MEIKYYFNFESQNLHLELDTDFRYTEDWEEIDKSKHEEYFLALNRGCRILDDGSISEPKPSAYHVWTNGEWIDPRTPEQIQIYELSKYKTLSRKQFRMMLVLNDYNLDEIFQKIKSIKDVKIRQLITIEWEDGTDYKRTDDLITKLIELTDLSEGKINGMWLDAMSL